MNEKDLIARIKKCLALGKSANPHEAAAAMRQAQKLMEMAGISHKEVELADITTGSVKTRAQNMPRWHHLLINTVAKGLGCQPFCGYDYLGASVNFVGTETRVEVAVYAYTVLRRQVMGARRKFIRELPKNCKPRTKTLRADSYCEGFVVALREKVQAIALPEDEQKRRDDYMREYYPDLVDGKAIRASGKSAKDRARQPSYLAQGYRDGDKVTLHQAVHGKDYRPAQLEQQQ